MNAEMLKKAKGAKSAEELKSLAESTGLTLTDEQAKEYYAKLSCSGELADEELDSVAGGGCGGNSSELIRVTVKGRENIYNIECPNCHARPVKVMGDLPYSSEGIVCHCTQCGKKIIAYIG